MLASELFSADFPEDLRRFFPPNVPAWEWLPQILAAVGPRQFIHPTAQVHATAVLEGGIYLGPDVRVGPFAYLRGGVIALKGATLGHACEFKNALLLPEAAAAHYNYVGDSVLGARSHLAAGAICANLRFDEKPVRVAGTDTGLRKLGALIGDGAQVGCNAVLMPGTLVLKGAIVPPLASAKGRVEAR